VGDNLTKGEKQNKRIVGANLLIKFLFSNNNVIFVADNQQVGQNINFQQIITLSV